MIFLETTYKTFGGIKKITTVRGKRDTQWVVYEDNKPAYFVDCFDLEKESNAMMNSLVLCTKRSIGQTLELINKKNNINLFMPKISGIFFKKKIKSELIELYLEPITEEWLAYSL